MAATPITLTTKASYGIGALGKDFAVSIIYVYLMFYYTDVAGLPAAFVGTLFLFARLIDAVTDPMMGMIVDNTKTRWGKFRPWILIGTLVNAFFLLLIFSTHQFEGTPLYIYATLTYILWGISYTIMDIPYWSMIPSLSSDREEREKLVVWPRLFASIAWWVMGTYGLYIMGVLDADDQGNSFFLFCVLIVGFFIFSSLLTVTKVKDVVKTDNLAVKFTIKDVITIINSNDQLKAFFGSVLTFNIAIQLISGFAIYYFTYAVGNKDLFSTFMFATAAEMTGIVLFPYLSKVMPRRFAWVFACGFPVLCCVVLLLAALTSPDNMWLIGIAGAAMKFGHGMANGLSTVMLADVVDYGEHKTGMRSESIIFSVQTMLVKGAGAVAGFFVGVGLSLVGYVPNQEQSADTVVGLQALMIVVPVLLMLCSAMVYRAYYKLHDGFKASDFATAS